MKEFLAGSWRVLKRLPLALAAPFLLLIAALLFLITDLLTTVFYRKIPAQNTPPSKHDVSVVIPNWNGRDLLEKYLPSVIASLQNYPDSEIIVVENASEDGSAEFLHQHFPQIRVLSQPRNYGFGQGSNIGFRAARHDIVILLNSDMRVAPDFVPPLLEGFTDDRVFAVSCQIFFSDAAKPRQETGLTEGWWSNGALRVRHRRDDDIRELYPCFYGGGGSCAFDRRKFLEIGGFDPLYHPFYLEDADLGYLAWKRGWKILYQPSSIVYHEHRGTIGKRFSDRFIHATLRKNFILFAWKNIHSWPMLASHFFFAWASSMVSWLGGDSLERASFGSIIRAFSLLPRALAARAAARRLAVVSDEEAFRRPLGGHFRDTFQALCKRPRRPNILFVSPYPICPPVHGGGVFMYQTVRELSRLCNLHLIALLDYEREREAHAELDQICASTHYMVRIEGRHKVIGSIEPRAVREFHNRDLAWLIQKLIYTRDIDILQLEYTVMGQYAGRFQQIPSILFEHDVYFQSIARRVPFMDSIVERITARWEYLRSLRYELRMLHTPDRIQVCSRENRDYLLSFLPKLSGRVDDAYRAGIDTSLYDFEPDGREPYSLLFLGSFRHLPNVEALAWFVNEVFPLIRAAEPRAQLTVVGSDPPPRHSLRNAEAINLVGFVDDVRTALRRYSVFVCPILSGSGVRVKLLEAFAAGIPVVSTRLGAEGLSTEDGHICALADDPTEFASHTVHLLRNPDQAKAMAQRARAEVVEHRDMRKMTERLLECYRCEISRKRANAAPGC
jgi:GT2 family glycosyltransferase